MNNIIPDTTMTLFVYTAYNTKTDKTNLVLTNSKRSKVEPYIADNCQQKYLQTLLQQIETVVIDGVVSTVEKQRFEKITLVFYRFKDKNLGHCLERVCDTLDKVRLLDEEYEDRFISGSLRRKNRTKPMSYDVLYRIIKKLLRLSRSCELEIEHSEMKDDITDIAWRMIKIDP